jgi:hypothetical protein
MTTLWEFEENTLDRLALMGRSPGLSSARRCFSSNPHKLVILSGAPHRWIADWKWSSVRAHLAGKDPYNVPV